MKRWFLGLGLVMMMAWTSACYIPGLGALGEADDPPAAGEITGLTDTYYGKFVIYQVAGGKLKNLKTGGGGDSIDYIVGEIPAMPPAIAYDDLWYNLAYTGGEDSISFHYRDAKNKTPRPASSGPEAVVLKNKLNLFYTDPDNSWSDSFRPEVNCGSSTVKNTPADAYPISPDTWWQAYINSATDVDYYRLTVPNPNTLAVITVRYTSFFTEGFEINEHPQLKLTVYDTDGTSELASSVVGYDFSKFHDPDLTITFPFPGDYFLRLEEVGRYWNNGCQDNADGQYWLQVETPTPSYSTGNYIKKAAIQPARSGNLKLQGGPTFEPDDIKTLVEDVTPDCDGIPGTGDEGDAGVLEMCGSGKDYGAGDGAMQYQEVDDKSAIDDGEYFLGKPTNIQAVRNSEATVIQTPDRNSLLMFVNYGDRIYMFESTDGQTGLTWDLSNLVNDNPSIVPRKERGVGDPDAPVVSSGVFGFCDTYPAAGDVLSNKIFEDAVSWGGLTGSTVNIPRAYPHTRAINSGGNGHLDSYPMKDKLGTIGGSPVITSGPDGIVNTYFAPKYIAYPGNPRVPLATPHAHDYRVFPPPNSKPGLLGPGVSNNPTLYAFDSDTFRQPLGGSTGGDNNRAYLLGDDDNWNSAVFGSTVPPVYMLNQGCTFYALGHDFDKCAMGSPIDPATGEQPISVLSGKDHVLQTADKVLLGDDVFCHDAAATSAVPAAICPGPNGKLDSVELYSGLEGDDEVALVVDTGYTGNPIYGISSGPDGILQTQLIKSYIIFEDAKLKAYYGGDYQCQTMDGKPAICPGNGQLEMMMYKLDLPSGPPVLGMNSRRMLISLWGLSLASGAPVDYIYDDYFDYPDPIGGNPPLHFYYAKQDLYGLTDDEFCTVNGQTALCPGPNGHFQTYPLSNRRVVKQSDDLFNLYDKVSDLVGKECYSLVSEQFQDEWTDNPTTRYVLYRYQGVRMDDQVMWSPSRGYYLTTGPNGINQSCADDADNKLIALNHGLPNVPIIVPGGDNVLQTYPLEDEKIQFDRGVYKIESGADGVVNSYALGDDDLQSFFGIGLADQPCVLAGPDGVADTAARGNDTQLYKPGEFTGFDAYETFGPKARVINGNIMLYYTGFGWLNTPPTNRPGAGDTNSEGECIRPGLDRSIGLLSRDMRINEVDSYKIFNRDYLVADESIAASLDNNEGVALAPRIGLAISTMKRLRANPADWKILNKPVIDLGRQCASGLSFPIDVGEIGIFKVPDPNWGGAFSPEIKKTDGPRGEDLYLMFFSGLYWEEKPSENPIDLKATVGLARSEDGIHWQLVRDINPIIIPGQFDLLSILSPGTNYAYPSIATGMEDDNGYNSYTMFLNQFDDDWLNRGGPTTQLLDYHKVDHIGLAVRKGVAQMSCSVRSDQWLTDQEKSRRALQGLFLLIPVGIFLGFHFSRRRNRD